MSRPSLLVARVEEGIAIDALGKTLAQAILELVIRLDS
jgi:hypothetical protein